MKRPGIGKKADGQESQKGHERKRPGIGKKADRQESQNYQYLS